VKFSPAPVSGSWFVDLQKIEDERGFFARTYCAKEFTEIGVAEPMVQDSLAYNKACGTLRGMHYHAAPFKQTRLIRCLVGAAYVVVLDLRPGSATFLEHFAAEFNGTNRQAVYVGTGLALGYQTLADDTEIYYQMTHYYDPQYERGVRWNDPAFNISWPEGEKIIKERDNQYPDFDPSVVQDLV